MTQEDNHNIDNLSGDEFEQLVASLFEAMGYEVEKTPVGPDGGIDLVLHSPDVVTSGKYIVQCKRVSSSVSEPILRDLLGTTHSEGALKGILVTNATFTQPAIEFAEGKTLELIDGNKLEDLLREHLPAHAPEGDDQVRLPPNLDLLCRRLNKNLDPVWKELSGIQSGQVHIGQKKIVQEQAYKTNMANSFNEVLDILEIWSLVVTEAANSALSHDSDASAEEVAAVADRLADPIKHILRLRKSLTKLVPPSEVSHAHSLLIDGLDELLQNGKDMHDTLIKAKSDPMHFVSEDEDREAVLDVRLDAPTYLEGYKLFQSYIDGPEESSSCAVVTACYGNPNAVEVVTLREWRDNELAGYLFGDFLIRLYALTSPPVAALFRYSSYLSKIGRLFVKRLIRTGWFDLN